ncbi:DUF4352 domain-containing protein [Spirillospora sp. CA-128828]|uniref:DUF4352 domain-containing protein n=1 Tax=Spirillospora sp. CA-128828 TaxID=3240033 RepID=UPI003D91C521
MRPVRRCFARAMPERAGGDTWGKGLRRQTTPGPGIHRRTAAWFKDFIEQISHLDPPQCGPTMVVKSAGGGRMLGRKEALVASALVVALGAAGCESANVNRTADTGKSGPSKQAKNVARVGDAVKITDKAQSIALRVTLVKVVKRAHSSNEFSTPGPGKRFVAAKFRIVNNAGKAYQDSPSNGATLIDTDGQSYSADIADMISGCPDFANGEVTLTSGESQVGCVAFTIAKTAHPDRIRFAAASGFSGSAEWKVR